MKITTLNKQAMIIMRTDIEAALKEIAKKFELKSLQLGAGGYSRDGKFHFRVEGVTDTPEATASAVHITELLGLPNDIVGKEIILQSRNFVVERIDERKPKNPVIIKDSQGRNYKVSVATALQGLKNKAVR